MSTDFIAEEWDTRNVEAPAVSTAAGEAPEGEPGLEEVAALAASLLMNEQVEEEKLRRRPAGEDGAGDGRSRWRERGWREAMRSL